MHLAIPTLFSPTIPFLPLLYTYPLPILVYKEARVSSSLSPIPSHSDKGLGLQDNPAIGFLRSKDSLLQPPLTLESWHAALKIPRALLECANFLGRWLIVEVWTM